MTFKEAKKILKKEGFIVEKVTNPCAISESFTEYEDPTICEAMHVIESAGYFISMEMSSFDKRKARLKKELEEHGNAPMPGPGEEQPKEKKGIIYPTTFQKADFYYKHVLNEVNPALKEAAFQFNDALLDEQGKKIEELTKEKVNLEDQITILDACKKHNDSAYRSQIKSLDKEIARLNTITHKKNLKIEKLKKERSEYLDAEVKFFGETVDLLQELCDKNEELRLSKIREKNLVEVSQKYMKEVEELNEKARSVNVHNHKELAEKDEVIADLGNELAATKKELEEKTKLVEVVRKGSKEYCEYGIAAEKMIRKMANIIVYKGKVSSKEFEEYRRLANGYRYSPQLYDFIEEEKKLEHAKKIRVSSDNAEEGADLYGVIVLCGKDFIDALKNVKDVWQE